MSIDETEAAARAGVAVARVRIWAAEGWVRPAQGARGPVFDALDVERLRLLTRLSDELEIGEEALPVVLSLLDQLHGLRREMRRLGRALDRLPPELRAQVAADCAAEAEAEGEGGRD
ncbi:chaperone modulator CbpM [Albimonas sp. CAU 1670]|uniref:chaperone modulator CbpM n=1 Tax=Albimonas sp. CAU 1670 TaxID=3032599 RepID=UPI0023D982DB|nr:chaperone modulator CbpM [Albimonas sp. CAU 1670]MDF2231822.1 chaperone modulator CbpM [Albimonas sp. CAU 1670]